MIRYEFNRTSWPDYDTGDQREWVITNGLGSYGGASLIGGLNRTHQGLLVASLCSPTMRYVTLERMNEMVDICGNNYDLETSRRRINGHQLLKEGYRYLTDVVYDGTVTYHYALGSASEKPAFEITKYIALKRDENTLALAYDLINHSDDEASLTFTPWLNFREHNTLSRDSLPKFDMLLTGNTLSLVPRVNPYVRIDISISDGQFVLRKQKAAVNSELITEVKLKTEGLTSHFTPYDITLKIPGGITKSFSIIVSVNYSEVIQGMALLQQASDCFLDGRAAHKIVEKSRRYYDKLLEKVPGTDDFAKRLILASDAFLCKRKSTDTETILAGLPWFTDWGRDTMIAFTGLTLCTGRYDDAGQILFTFAKYMENGLVPNMFPDDNSKPLYNTADASLWYFIAVYKYLKYLGSDENVDKNYLKSAAEFINDSIFPCLISIIDAYEKGTDYSIRMLNNGLIACGSDLDQVTWMDVRVGDKVMTPRHGCPVEINALWYNALCITDYLCRLFGYDGSHYRELSELVKYNFKPAFFNQLSGCLYDVVVYNEERGDFTSKDDSIRPNQIYAVSLPFDLLSPMDARQVVDVVMRRLYVGVGLRTLSSDHPDYHGLYRGALEERDEAYHQGTAWPYLLGAFFTAYSKLYGATSDGRETLIKFFEPIKKHLMNDNCIGGICEVFDGDKPHLGGGCYTQAWSVGEILRSYTEDVLRKKKTV